MVMCAKAGTARAQKLKQHADDTLTDNLTNACINSVDSTHKQARARAHTRQKRSLVQPHTCLTPQAHPAATNKRMAYETAAHTNARASSYGHADSDLTIFERAMCCGGMLLGVLTMQADTQDIAKQALAPGAMLAPCLHHACTMLAPGAMPPHLPAQPRLQVWPCTQVAIKAPACGAQGGGMLGLHSWTAVSEGPSHHTLLPFLHNRAAARLRRLYRGSSEGAVLRLESPGSPNKGKG